jgi:peptidoglycan/xylan/chitin deacetylase (PgdA/CDA1 family)
MAPSNLMTKPRSVLVLLAVITLIWNSPSRAQDASTNAPTPLAPADQSAAPTVIPDVPLPPNFHRDKPAYIVIKTDDLVHAKGDTMPPNWEHLGEDIKARKIKASIGIICTSLEDDSPKYIQWIKDLHDTGLVEFWFHGYDHKPHITNNLVYGELDGRTYDDIKERFTKSQQMAKDKLGFNFESFGQPGASPIPGAMLDKNTHYESLELLRALREDPTITTWMTASLLDDVGKQIEAEGKITILDRIYQVNIEQPIFKPNYAAFVKGYAQFPNREYFVIQGHPPYWKGDSFAQFDKILDFLQSQNAIFVTPKEMAEILKKEGQGAASVNTATGSTPATVPAAQ